MTVAAPSTLNLQQQHVVMQPWELHSAMEQLKSVLQQRGAWEHVCQEPTCAQRFLCAAQHDADKACSMLLEMLRWRKDNGIDQMLGTFCFPEREALLAAYPQGYHNTDRLGRPVYIQQLGRADIDALLSVTSEERMLMWHITEYERLLRVILPPCSAAAGRPVHQSFSILDLKGIKFRDFMKVKGVLTSFCKLDNAYYPETSGHMAIINAPSWFGGVFSFFKSFMSPEAQKRVEIMGSNWKQQLLCHIAPENLHHEYGGTSHGCITDDIGPWQQHKQHAAAASVHMHVSFSSNGSSLAEKTTGGAQEYSQAHQPPLQQQQAAAIARTSPQLQCAAQQPHLHIHVPRMESYNSCDSQQYASPEDATGAQLTPMSAAALSFHSLQSASGFHTPHSSFAGSLLGTSDSHLGDFTSANSKTGLLGHVKRVGKLGSSLVGRRPRRRHVDGAAAAGSNDSSGRAGVEEGADFWCPLQGGEEGIGAKAALWQPPVVANGRRGSSVGGGEGRSLLDRAKSGVASSFSFLAGQRVPSSEGMSTSSGDGSLHHGGAVGVGSRSSRSGSMGWGSGRLLSADGLEMEEEDGSYRTASSGCCGLRLGRR